MKDSLTEILTSDLMHYAHTKGYIEKDTRKSSTNWIVLKNPTTNDKIRINSKGRNGTMFFQNNDPGLDMDRGNIINFCINRLDGFPNPTPKPSKDQFKKAFSLLKAFIGDPDIEKITFKSKVQTGTSASTKLKEIRQRTSLTDKYLKEHRSIDPHILNLPLFAGTIAESKAVMPNGTVIHNTAFLKKDAQNNTVGYTTHFYSKRKNKQEKIVNQIKEGLYYSNFEKTPNNIFITETAVDALSHFELIRPKEAAYISLEGQISPDKIKIVQELFNAKGSPKNILSITDNDYAGYQFDLKLAVGLHNLKQPQNPIEMIQNDNYTRFVLQGNTDFSTQIKNNTIAIFDKETTVFGNQHLKSYLNIGFTKNFSFIELPRDKSRKLFRFYEPLTKAIYKLNNIQYFNNKAPSTSEKLHPIKDWNEMLQLKKKEQEQHESKGLKY